MNAEGTPVKWTGRSDARKSFDNRTPSLPLQKQHLFCRILLPVLALLTVSRCTPVEGVNPEAHELTATVTADETVRGELDDVEVVVESRTRESNSWRLEESRRFTPDPADASSWPLVVRVHGYDPKATYLATATARDGAGAIIIQTRTIADPNVRSTQALQLRFDGECLRRTSLCSKTLTCSLGECVDAHEPLSERGDSGKSSVVQASTRTGSAEGGVSEAGDCSVSGQLACAQGSSLQPLVCEDRVWHKADACADMTRCDDSASDTHGTCQPIAVECAMRKAGERYCDNNGQMFECQTNEVATLKLCGDNEQCTDIANEVRCTCKPGFLPAAQGCMEPVDCRDMGGCDPQTECIMQNGKRACTACPAGFSGTGQTGCAPLLSNLTISPGKLDPQFDPNVKQYTLHVPLLMQRITIQASSTVDAELLVNNSSAMLGRTWTSSVLAPGQTQLPITLRASSGARSDYLISVDHSAAAQTYGKAAEGHSGDGFGTYLAAEGNTLVAGAPYEIVNGESNAGAVYVFVREGSTWRQQARLVAPSPTTDAFFGVSMALSGERLVVSRPGMTFAQVTPGTHPGSAVSFVRSGDSWNLEQEIKLDTATNEDGFGFIVALHGDALVVGAPLDDTGALNSGAAYVYTRSGGSWQQQAQLKASAPQAESHFGTMLSVDGNSVAVGAWQETVSGMTRAGAVYIYQHSGSRWTLQSRVTAPTIRTLAQFGGALVVQGDTLIVSAAHNPFDFSSNRSGEVHVFKRDGADYRAVQLLEAPQPAIGDHFGNNVRLTPTALIVGSPGAQSAGGAYLYSRTDDGFVRTADLKASNADDGDQFGFSVALTDDFAACGAPYEDGGAHGINGNAADNSLQDSGALYIFD